MRILTPSNTWSLGPTRVQAASVSVKTFCSAAEHRRFSRIRQVAPIYTTLHVICFLGPNGVHKTNGILIGWPFWATVCGWIKMPLGTEVRLGPGDIVLDGDPASPSKNGDIPIFGPCLLWPTLKLRLRMGRSGLYLIGLYRSLDPNRQPKRHLDQFSRFCRAD